MGPGTRHEPIVVSGGESFSGGVVGLAIEIALTRRPVRGYPRCAIRGPNPNPLEFGSTQLMDPG